jgi:hypothetical protein
MPRAAARYPLLVDARALTSELTARLRALGIGHEVEFVEGAAAQGTIVRGPYADPVTVVEHDGRYQLVTRGGDGKTAVVDTEIETTRPLDLLALYLAFHSLWAMKRLVDRNGVEAVARRLPDLSRHQQLTIAFIATSLTSADPEVVGYAQGLMTNATAMLQG